MNIKHTFLAGCIGLSLLGGAAYAYAAACQNVDFAVKNDSGAKIKALKVEYKTKQDGKWRTEQIPNVEVPNGQKVQVAENQSLQYIEGHDMTNLKLHYQQWCGSAGWSKTFTYTDSNLADPRCNSNSGKSYRVDLPAVDHCR